MADIPSANIDLPIIPKADYSPEIQIRNELQQVKPLSSSLQEGDSNSKMRYLKHLKPSSRFLNKISHQQLGSTFALTGNTFTVRDMQARSLINN